MAQNQISLLRVILITLQTRIQDNWREMTTIQLGSLQKELILPCMMCPLCNKLLREATTITECLHTFCRKCIQKRLSGDEGGYCCPICNINLGPVPLDKLRSDYYMQELRAIVFPYKRKRQDSAAGEPSNNLNTETMENTADQWKPVDRLMKAANRSKSEETKKARRTKARRIGEYQSQVVSHASRIELGKRNFPVWFSLVPLEGDWLSLPRISKSYIRIKDGNIPVSFIQRYLKEKLGLVASEDEIEIKCMGQSIDPALAMNSVVKMWLQTTTRERVAATIGSPAKEFVMVLSYARRVICLSD